jgi:hypothetical protein
MASAVATAAVPAKIVGRLRMAYGQQAGTGHWLPGAHPEGVALTRRE